MSYRQLMPGEALAFLDRIGVDKGCTETDLATDAPMAFGCFLEGELAAMCTLWAPGQLPRGSKKSWTIDACYVSEKPNAVWAYFLTFVEYITTNITSNVALLVNHKDVHLLVAGLTNGFTRWLHDIDEYTLYGYTESRPYSQVCENADWYC